MKKGIFCWMIISLFLHSGIRAQVPSNWQELETVDALCRAYPDRMDGLLRAIDLDRKDLRPVKEAYDQGDIVQACRQLLEYYQEGNTASYLRRESPAGTSRDHLPADTISRGIFTFYNQTDRVPVLEDGRLNWAYEGPADDIEWAWGLNRHPFLQTLLGAYLETGNADYAGTVDRYVKDWVISSLPYPQVKSRTAMWRGLEVSFRVKRWAEVFYGLMECNRFSPATRLLLLSSIPEHAHYLRQFHAQGNWLTMEMSALLVAATAWPEFKKSAEWLDYSRNAMTESLAEQLYSDGVQTELTAHYHYVALNNFNQFLETCREAGEPLPESYPHRIEQMWNYLAYSLRPSGTNPLNNDSDLRNYQERISRVAGQFDRPDWLYIATNGKDGKAPEKKSLIFPYAGQVILRNGWEEKAHWAFFDVGPWGSGHQHNDKLHLSVSAYGRDLLVDGGRFAYRGAVADQFRPYARGSESHNVILLDGKGQAPGPKEATGPLDDSHYLFTDRLDYAWNSVDHFQDLEGTAEHSRAIAQIDGKFWIVADRIRSDRPRKVEVLWHWHPDNTVRTGRKKQVATDNPRGNLQIMSVGKNNWQIEMVKGREKPQSQGWYSPEYNRYSPNMTSIYTTEVPKEAYFVWLLYPTEGVPLTVKARILSQGPDGVKVRIKSKEGKWELDLPFADSKQAQLR